MASRRLVTRNLLLGALASEDHNLLRQHLARVALARGGYLSRAHRPIDHVYFMEDGVASVISPGAGAGGVEMAVIGREGIAGTASVLMAEQSPHDTLVQVDHASALRIETGVLQDVMRVSEGLRTVLLRFVQTLLVQTGTNAVANISHRLDARLARWLLMCHDRVEGDDIAITHEFMAIMIGAQRSAVTAALHVLEGAALVRARRGNVTVLDRAGLETVAGAAYGTAEAEYRRLIGAFGKTAASITRMPRRSGTAG